MPQRNLRHSSCKKLLSISHPQSEHQRFAENPHTVAGDCFTANGKGINLGYFGKEENLDIAEKMRVAFSEWINNGHNNFEDENTCILQIELTDGVLFSHGTRYDIDFTE